MYTENGINFKQWINEHRHLLKPPVGNQLVFPDGEFIVMVVGGPNSRKDYHFNEGEEFFYQIEGDITIKIMVDGRQRDVTIAEGEIFLLPARVPHSPQRGEGTVGLVVERKRLEGELDGFHWYCESCNEKLYEEYFMLENIVTQFPPIVDRFYSSTALRTCNKCGTVMSPPIAATV